MILISFEKVKCETLFHLLYEGIHVLCHMLYEGILCHMLYEGIFCHMLYEGILCIKYRTNLLYFQSNTVQVLTQYPKLS